MVPYDGRITDFNLVHFLKNHKANQKKIKKITKKTAVGNIGTYIRKTAALYLLQESVQLSEDPLLRVRAVRSNQITYKSTTLKRANCAFSNG